jgi:photosystem II stability/assembly factor-like uncharacterized protein
MSRISRQRSTALSATFPLVIWVLVPGFLVAQTALESNTVYDPALFAALEYRLIGPSRGGRATAVTGVTSQPYTFFMGTTGGGVWKTEDAGETWRNISDDFFDVASVGAVDVADSDVNVIYVGTGSACIRGNVSTGRGVYRSLDGGKSWTMVGLRDTGAIGRIVVHPHDPDLVYVAALGHPFGTNEERGVFRSTDGGESWQRVLFVSDSTGAIDLSMNPNNPREIYAAMWRAERKPWTLIDAAEEGGVYKSTDGGEEWVKLGGGLPEGLLGRIGVAVSPANPERVWALVNAHDPQGGLYRSDDAGDTWTRVNRQRELRQRAWYYTHIYTDPQDENTIYALNTRMYRSVDGGKTFQTVRVPHGDVHDLWINPDSPEKMVVANDGGAQVTLTAGRSWSTMLNQPTAELYRVTVDNQFPYRVYAGQQDNSTISVPSWSAGTLTNTEEWFGVGGCESGHVAVNAENPDLIYAGCYIGEITRYDRRTEDMRHVTVYPVLVDGVAPRDLDFRFQWNAPIVFSPHDPDLLYHTSNHVHRTRDGGITWETISPDLTQNDPNKQALPGGPLQHDHTSVEVYSTIFAFAESPHTAGTLWTGSDDGLIHLSRDDGATWDDVTPSDMPADGTVNSIDLSPHQAGRVVVAVYRYRMDDFAPYVFRTNDFGRSWELLTDGSNGIPEDQPVRVVREDPDRPGLLYAGTEFGMFVSFDDGRHWQSLQLNLPAVPVTDLKVHQKDLVLATQGRSFWILDDLTLLHQLADDTNDWSGHLFAPRPTHIIQRRGRSPEPPPDGTVIRYYFAEEPAGEVTLEILDGTGAVIRSFSSDTSEAEEDEVLPASSGSHQFVWDLRHEGLELPQGAMVYLGYAGGPMAVPGTYQVRLSADTWSETRPFELLGDPRMVQVTQRDLEEQFDLGVRIRARLADLYEGMNLLRSVRDQVEAMAERAQQGGFGVDLGDSARVVAGRLTAIEDRLTNTKSESHQDPINFPPMLDNQFGYLYRYVANAYGRPTRAAYQRFEELESQLDRHLAGLREVLDTDVARFSTALRDRGVPGIVIPTGSSGTDPVPR